MERRLQIPFETRMKRMERNQVQDIRYAMLLVEQFARCRLMPLLRGDDEMIQERLGYLWDGEEITWQEGAVLLGARLDEDLDHCRFELEMMASAFVALGDLIPRKLESWNRFRRMPTEELNDKTLKLWDMEQGQSFYRFALLSITDFMEAVELLTWDQRPRKILTDLIGIQPAERTDKASIPIAVIVSDLVYTLQGDSRSDPEWIAKLTGMIKALLIEPFQLYQTELERRKNGDGQHPMKGESVNE